MRWPCLRKAVCNRTQTGSQSSDANLPRELIRRRYVYKEIGPGDSIELIRELADHRDKHAVAFRHRGVHIGYVPRRHQWVAHAIDDGRRLVAIVDKVRVGGIFRRRAKYVRVRIAVLNPR